MTTPVPPKTCENTVRLLELRLLRLMLLGSELLLLEMSEPLLELQHERSEPLLERELLAETS